MPNGGGVVIITVKWASRKYAHVSVQEGSTTIDFGPLNKKEQQELSKHLRDVADDLYPYEEEVEL